MEKMVYICCKTNNTKTIAKMLNILKEQHPECCFFSPLIAFAYLDQLDRDYVMEHYIFALAHCDEIWTFGKSSNSEDCRVEQLFAERHKIPMLDMGVMN